MDQWLMQNETEVRLGFFIGVFVLVALWELMAPRRSLNYSKTVRWYSNLGVAFLNSAVLRLVFPLLATGLAVMAEQNGWGILNNVDLPYGLSFVIALVLMDLVIYLQHVLFHALPLLWRFHRMHHTDLDFDVTTGARFHPIEIILSMVIKMMVVVAIGPPVLAVLVFEVLLNLTSMFNHGNIHLPISLDRILRKFVVTPDMHRVHHSTLSTETNTNFGFNLPWWDHMFGTYCDQPEHGHEGMTIGITQFRHSKELHLHRLVIQPFLGSTREYPMGQRRK